MSKGKADHEDVRLDKDFRKNIDDIKPFVLKLVAKGRKEIFVFMYKTILKLLIHILKFFFFGKTKICTIDGI